MLSILRRRAPDVIHFVTNGTLVLEKGRVKLGTLSKDGSVRRAFRIDYPKTLTPAVEAKDVTDKRHLKSWGKQIYRLVFTSSAKAPLSGSYTFKITLEE